MTDNEKRTELISRYNQLLEERWNIRFVLENEKTDENFNKRDAIEDEIMKVSEDYKELLYPVNISRCPYTGMIVTYDMDLGGLDGPWWNLEVPVRKELFAPDTYFALDGAMKLKSEDITSEFQIAPGPDKPFVIPGILENTEIKAVLTSTMLDGHQIWWITYFTYPIVVGVQGVNLYGTETYRALSPIGLPHVFSEVYSERDYDYDLAKWIRAGKLLWVTPGDNSFKLNAYVEGCPYLDLPGHGRIQLIGKSGLRYMYGKDE